MSELHIPRRYELKYVVTQAQADAVRLAIAPFCRLDRNSADAPDHEYSIKSIYLDSPARDLYRVSREGRDPRFKVRVRRYGSGGAVFLEVKRKEQGLVRKSRARVPASEWPERLLSRPADTSPAEQAFLFAVDRYQLAPALLVHYEREAWASFVDDYARVTLDRQIRCQAPNGWDFEGDPSAWLPLDHAGTMHGTAGAALLELKCTQQVPAWMAHLTEQLELWKSGFSKYCNGLERLEGHASLPSFLPLTPRW